MPKFKIHIFEEVRQSYIVEGNSMQEAVNHLISNLDNYSAVEAEFTGDYSNDVCVDPLFEDGTPDLNNYQWLKLSGEDSPNLSANG